MKALAAQPVPIGAPARARRRRVALYYPWVYLTSGAERTILGLARHSRHDWTLFTNHFDRDATFPEFADLRVVELPGVPVRRSMGAVSLAASRIMTQRLPVDGFDAVVVVCEGVGDLALFRCPIRPAFCICLTPLRAAFDPEYRRRVVARRRLPVALLLKAGLAAFAAVDRLAWKRYSRVFCISEETKRRATAGRLAAPDALEVLHVGVGLRGQLPSDRFEPFFLVPGRIMWTKNLELAIEAFLRFRAQHTIGAPFRLVIAGAVDHKSEPYLASLKALAESSPDIEFRIAPSDAELRELYRTCYAALFPAFNEDWGIVPIEAMSFGKPVIATNCGGPLEIVHDRVDGFLETPDPAAFASRMVDLARVPSRARAMGQAGFNGSLAFSWDRFAGRINQVIEEATP